MCPNYSHSLLKKTPEGTAQAMGTSNAPTRVTDGSPCADQVFFREFGLDFEGIVHIHKGLPERG